MAWPQLTACVSLHGPSRSIYLLLHGRVDPVRVLINLHPGLMGVGVNTHQHLGHQTRVLLTQPALHGLNPISQGYRLSRLYFVIDEQRTRSHRVDSWLVQV
jgi:hypothetical protein